MGLWSSARIFAVESPHPLPSPLSPPPLSPLPPHPFPFSLLLSTSLALHLPFTPLPLPSPLPFFLPSPLLLSLLLSPFSPIQSPQQDMCMDPLNGSISVDPINGSNQWIHFCFLFKLDNLLKKQKRQLLEKAEEASLLNEIQEYIDQGIQSRAYIKLN